MEGISGNHLVLSLECSSSRPGWALLDDDHVLASAETSGRASSSLMQELDTAFAKLPHPGTILIGVGPGSFSGIRVAIAAAQGLARVWGCTVIPVRSTHAIARELAHASFLGVFADARRGHWFATFYESGRMTGPSLLIPLEEVDTWLSKCTLAAAPDPLPSHPSVECHPPSAAALALAWKETGTEPDLALDPIYLHTTVAKLPA